MFDNSGRNYGLIGTVFRTAFCHVRSVNIGEGDIKRREIFSADACNATDGLVSGFDVSVCRLSLGTGAP